MGGSRPALLTLAMLRQRVQAALAAGLGLAPSTNRNEEIAGRPSPSDAREFVPAGHFYSAIPSQTRIDADAARLFAPPPRALPGIDLREEAQLALLRALEPLYDSQPFPTARTPPLRYWFENDAYSYSDAIFLQAMIRHLRPKRIVEVGCGHSSCVMLDTIDLFLGGAVECTFVDPHPALLRSLLRPGDEARVGILPHEVQRLPLAVFERLEPNDILFVDSTHVAKIGSDVNHLMFEVLPRLAPGVHVHFHDVFYPFEYPESWVREGRAWNEAYVLRAFLSMSSGYEIVLFNTFLETFHEDYFARRMPLCLRDRGGSMWLRRRG